ncbi:hypothetical protein HYX58_01055 [Candidatus Dependentiae bacterium]|nr:hypothetical protein [Candidatus Dependentiae bacterium]
MKKVISIFKISEDSFIELYFPDLRNKQNFYCAPTSALHKFDEVTAQLNINHKTILLQEGELRDMIWVLYRKLQRAQQKTCELPNWIEIGDFVRCLNESDKDDAEQRYKDIDFSNFWLWSMASGAQSFVYTRNGKIYLEVGYIYKWHSRERKDSDTDYIPYEEFIKNYKPILVQEITPEMAQEWSAQCESLIKQIE